MHMHAHAPVIDDARETLARVITQLRADPVALATAADAARFVGHRGDVLPQAEVRRQIEVVLDAVLASLGGTGVPSAQLAAADDFAVDRAKQGIPLTVILEGFNAARQFMLKKILEVQSGLMPADDLIRVLVPLDEHVSELHARMINRYREAERTLARSGRAARIDALRELLGGGPVTWAEQAELDLGRQYHCVLADVTNPRESTRIEALLETPEGLSGIVRGYLCRVTPQYPPDRDLDVLAVASMPVPPHELADAYRLCRDALSAGRSRGVTGLHPVTDLALGVAVDAQPLLGRMLAREQLKALSPDDAFHRLLAETARVYLQHGSRVEPTAAVLHVHPNTVKYRVRRLAELTSFEPSAGGEEALDHTMRWWWALGAWLDGAGRP
jgi:hypothetical protein